MTAAVLRSYMEGHGSTIVTEGAAERARTLFTEFLAGKNIPEAAVSFWTPSQQLEFAKWSLEKYSHSAGNIARNFNVLRAAIIDATAIKLRPDGLGNEIEAALIASAPKIVMTQERIADELKIPKRRPRRATLSIEQMAEVIDAIQTEHLFRFAIMELSTWARPQALTDFRPDQVDWNDGVLDLAPIGWVQTNKRRPRQPVTQCLSGWLQAWTQLDAQRDARDIAAGIQPREPGLLVYKRKRVTTVKRAFRRIGEELGIEGFSQYSFRHFMADQVKKLFRGVPRELRSRWLGHVVRDGSRTTDSYEGDDPHELEDVALATDTVIALVAEHTTRPLFAIEPRLNRASLKDIGARQMPKRPDFLVKNGGRDRDRTCDPSRVKVVRIDEFRAKSTKRRA